MGNSREWQRYGASRMNGNLLENIPESIDEELFETLARRGAVRIERIVSDGHASADDFGSSHK